MVLGALLGFALAGTAQTPPVSISYSQGSFIIRSGREMEVVPAKLETHQAPKAVAFRRNKTYAVWDSRGLTIRVGSVAKSFRLPELAVSPRLSSREQILETLKLVEAGKRTKEASALSGGKRLGNWAYFLARWDDTSGKPWLEALARVSLIESKPAWRLVGKFEGVSLGRGSIDDRLYTRAGSLVVVERLGEAWGEASYSPTLGAFGFRPMGKGLEAFMPQAEGRGLFVERTGYGSQIGGEADGGSGSRHELIETHAKIEFVDTRRPIFAILGGRELRNAETGAAYV
ncbi:MAG: hypothetical protein HY248_04025, partial [Fimbriimonas ginsengisoli]|nr:hypothetical protein [Fimbriimonas ginsengisoli]